jgi:hypothetical protein
MLAPERLAELTLPDDELHREILLPLLPALIRDKAIRTHWLQCVPGGFYSRFKAMDADAPVPPTWVAADFEIHVTASYLAGADARALADTLLSEGTLREMAAAILNTVFPQVWAQTVRGRQA